MRRIKNWTSYLEPMKCSFDYFRRLYYITFLKLLNFSPSIIVLGNQKSGTTAIATLLAQSLKFRYKIDILGAWEDKVSLYRGNLNMEDFIKKHPYSFTFNLLKEPDLTFIFGKLFYCFPNSKYVFVIRHPVDNIRSILDRVDIEPSNIPANIESIDVEEVWKAVLRGDLFAKKKGSQDIISNLSYRWLIAAKIYLKNKSYFHLVKYESFLKDKVKFIDDLCNALNIRQKVPIKGKENKQYQPRGKNRNVPVTSLFPQDTINRIEGICYNEIQELGYDFYSKK